MLHVHHTKREKLELCQTRTKSLTNKHLLAYCQNQHKNEKSLEIPDLQAPRFTKGLL